MPTFAAAMCKCCVCSSLSVPKQHLRALDARHNRCTLRCRAANTMVKAVEGSASSQSRTSAIRVLVVDDDEGARLAIAEILQTEGFFVELASDGGTALRHARDSR